MEKDYKAYLSHIFESIVSIEKYTEGMSFEEFEKDQKTIDAVIRNFEIIGEASNKLSKEFRERYLEMPFDNKGYKGHLFCGLTLFFPFVPL